MLGCNCHPLNPLKPFRSRRVMVSFESQVILGSCRSTGYIQRPAACH